MTCSANLDYDCVSNYIFKLSMPPFLKASTARAILTIRSRLDLGLVCRNTDTVLSVRNDLEYEYWLYWLC
jgi:hypothetical protein